MQERVYLDWNATAPLCPEARAAVAAALEVIGNPSSVHGEGRQARHLVEQARGQVAALVGAEPRNVIFTSGGTEANVLALTPSLDVAGESMSCGCLLMSAIEHPSVRAAHRFPASAVEELPVTPEGVVDLVALRTRLARLSDQGGKRPLISVMHANNETGVVQPIADIARLVHDQGGLLHVDAVQSAGRIPCNINNLGADLLTLSGHKLGAPKGIGALVKRSEALQFDPLVKGGGQERGNRAGTENVMGIMGFGAAAAAAGAALGAAAQMAGLRDRLEAGLQAISPDIVIFGAGVERVPNTSLFALPGARAETVLIALDLEGIAVSSGAACSSGKVAASAVLAAMGVPVAVAMGAIRVSLGPTTSESAIEFFLSAWSKLVMALSKGRRGIAA